MKPVEEKKAEDGTKNGMSLLERKKKYKKIYKKTEKNENAILHDHSNWTVH